MSDERERDYERAARRYERAARAMVLAERRGEYLRVLRAQERREDARRELVAARRHANLET